MYAGASQVQAVRFYRRSFIRSSPVERRERLHAFAVRPSIQRNANFAEKRGFLFGGGTISSEKLLAEIDRQRARFFRLKPGCRKRQKLFFGLGAFLCCSSA